jgi:hypothetical protein
MTPKDSEENNWGFGTDDPVNTAAGKLYGHHVRIVRDEAAKYDIKAERLRQTYAAAREEADRSAAILLFAMAEDLMLDGLRQHLHGEVAGGWQEVASGNGLLATANDRITLLALLGWIHPTVYADLRIMKAIRNRFAHHPDVIGFDENKVRGFISSLSPQEKAPLAAANAADAPLTPRQLYLLRAGATLMRLVHNLAVAPVARRENVAPGHVDGADWAQAPANIQELHRILAEHVLLVAK